MRLQLINFRCFKNKTFTFPDEGIVLLNAESGGGKTSILKAIHFALFGKEQRIITHGEKKCSVVLELPSLGWTIKRTKGPIHLILETTEGIFKDASAESIIQKKFGTHFTLTNYVAQKQIDSFFSLSAAEKTTFLHNISLLQFNVDELKNKLKGKLKVRKAKCNEYTTKCEVLKELLDRESINIEETYESPIFPFKLGTKTDEEFKLEEDRQQKNNNDKIKSLSTSISLLEIQKQKYEHIKNQKIISQSQLEELLKQQKEVDPSLEHSLLQIIKEINRSLVDIEQCIYKCKQDKELKRLIEEVERDKKEMTLEYESMIQSLSEKVDTNDYSLLIKEIDTNIIKLSQEEKYFKKVKEMFPSISTTSILEDLKKEYSDRMEEKKEFDNSSLEIEYNKKQQSLSVLQKEWNDIKLQLSGKHMKCPKCKSGVSLIQDQLLEHNPDLLEKRKVDLKKEMDLIQSSLSAIKQNINENKETLSDIDSELHTISQFIKEYSTIEKSNQQYTLQEFQKQKESYQKLQVIQTSINNDIARIKKEQQQLKELSHPRLKTKYQSISLIENKIKTIQLSVIYESSKSEEEWLEYKDNLKKQLQKHNQELDLYKKELHEQSLITSKIKTLESNIAQMSTIEDVSKDLQSKHEEREERYKKAEKFSSREQKINKYFGDKQVYIRQSKLVNDYNQSLNDEKIAIRALSKAEELLEILIQTENEILDNILQTINREIEEWMEFLFQDGTSMTLMSYKETKDGDKKSCIDIRIHREGEDIPLDSLSGGEYDRVAFALFLAFYTTTSSGSLLMLDECFSSLHSELVEDIVERLKEKVNNGLILMTLHQANTGFFDVVMNVEK